MKLDNVFKKTRIAVGRKNYITFTRRPEVPEGLLRKCNKCGGAIIAEDVKKDHYICPKCGDISACMRDEGSRWLQMKVLLKSGILIFRRESSGIQRIRRKTGKTAGKDRAFRSSHNRKSKD